MGLEGSYKDKSGVPDMIVHAWMGHKAYLNQYDKLGRRGMAKIYKDNMHVVTVHEVGLDEKAIAKYTEMSRAHTEMSKEKDIFEAQTIEDSGFMHVLGGRLDIPEIASAVNLDDKKRMIFEAIEKKEKELTQIKMELLRTQEKSLDTFKEALEILQNE